MKKLKNRIGFTLLELLVVIGIIGLLVSVGISSFSTAQKKARDAKRKSDLKAIQSALEQYYSVCGFTYPTPSGGNVPSSIACVSPAVTLMNSVPLDPKSNVSYTMTQTSSSDYTICAPNNPPLEAESTNPYCLTNQQ
ncbi:type II secretion system GspH family protein [Patescibacteria group bacterium]|nr:type II secretion system GspH family protein [Patescibacteria group bacterium]